MTYLAVGESQCEAEQFDDVVGGEISCVHLFRVCSHALSIGIVVNNEATSNDTNSRSYFEWLRVPGICRCSRTLSFYETIENGLVCGA